MRMRSFGWVLCAVAVAGAVFAGTPVDQGKPGTQGPWPVTVVSGGLSSDGGVLGYVTVVQGPGIDGGTAWNVTGSVGSSSGRWELVNEFDVAAWLVTDGGLSTSTRLYLGYPPDGGAWTWEWKSTTSATSNLLIRDVDVSGQALMVQAYVATDGGTGSMSASVRLYTDRYPSESTAGTSAIFDAAFMSLSPNSSGAVVIGGAGTLVSGSFYPVRPNAVAVFLGGSSSPSLTNAVAAKVRLWRIP